MVDIPPFVAYAHNRHQKNITLTDKSELQYVLHRKVLINQSYEPFIEYTLKVRQPNSKYFIHCDVFDGGDILVKTNSTFKSIVKDLRYSIVTDRTFNIMSFRLKMTLPMIQKKMHVIQKAVLAIIPEAIERKLIRGA